MRGGLQLRCRPYLYTAIVCLAALVLYAISNIFSSSFRSVSNTAISLPYLLFPTQRHCQAGPLLPAGEKYMLYAPHIGFSNQVGELKNALLVAALLNRTLVLPPIFDRHAVALGSCPKFRVHEPYKLRALAWAHITELVCRGRYIAIADVLDLSLVVPRVKLVDLRIFIRMWCGVDITSACLCRSLAAHSSTWGTLESCGILLSKPDEVHGSCVYGVNEDCRTTIWVHNAAKLGNIQTNQSLQASKAAAVGSWNPGATKNVIKVKYGWRRYREIVEALGNGSEAGKYEVLSFGSLFSSEYKGSQLHVDIESSEDQKVRALVEAMKFIPLTPPIVNAGKQFSKERIKNPYFCAHLRLLDGQFKNHWEKTFVSLKSQLKVAQEQQNQSQALNVFVMTDLPRSNWSKTYLGELDVDKSFKLHTLDGNDPMIHETAIALAKCVYGLRSGYLPPHNKTMKIDMQYPVNVNVHPDILLFVEQVICSCASLGFVGTSGSTLGANILQLRSGNTCATKSVE